MLVIEPVLVPVLVPVSYSGVPQETRKTLLGAEAPRSVFRVRWAPGVKVKVREPLGYPWAPGVKVKVREGSRKFEKEGSRKLDKQDNVLESMRNIEKEYSRKLGKV